MTDRVGVYIPTKGADDPERLGPAEVTAKFGVPPELVVDKLALMGDSSDNVPGVPGIGAKTADKLLDQFGSLEAVLEGCDQIKAKGVRQKVTDNIAQARLSKELVTIDTEVPIEFDLEAMKRQPADYQAVKELFIELEFTRLIKQFMPEQEEMALETQAGPTTHTGQFYHTVNTVAELKKLVAAFSAVKELSLIHI